MNVWGIMAVRRNVSIQSDPICAIVMKVIILSPMVNVMVRRHDIKILAKLSDHP